MSNGASSSSSLSTDKKAGSTTQDCPLKENKTVPCDIGNLELTCIDSDGKTHKTNANEPRTLRDNPKQVKDFPFLENRKYYNVLYYDTVLEVLAPPLRTDATEVKKAIISANVNKPIGTCPKSEHPHLVVRNPNYDDNDGVKSRLDLTLQSMAPVDIYGKSLPIDNHVNHLKLKDLMYFFEDTRKPHHIKDITVEAQACGVRDDGVKPNKKMLGLIRVYREDKYVLEVKIPSLISKEASYKEERSINGERTETEVRFAGEKKEISKFGKDGRMTEYQEQDEQYFLTKSETLHASDNQIKPDDTTVSEFFTIKRNGQELAGLEFINNIITARKVIIGGFTFIEDLRKAVPQVGFGWSFNLDVLAGTVGGEWGIQAGSEYDTAEYKWVEPYGKIKLSMSLLKVEFAAFFGVECKSPAVLNWFKNPAWEVIAKVEVKVSIDCKVETDIKLAGSDNADKIPKIGKENSTNPDDFESVRWINEFASTGEFYGQFKVNVAGYGMDAKAGVAVSFSAKYTVVKPFKLRGEVKRNEAYIYAYFTHAKRKKSPPWKKVLCREKEIMSPRYVFE